MRLDPSIWSAVLATSSLLSSVSGSPLDRRQTTSTAISSEPTAALAETTISGKATTVEVAFPTSSDAAASTTVEKDQTVTASSTISSATYSSTAAPLDPSEHSLQCEDEDAKPFCLPHDHQDVYVGSRYYVTWNSKYFAEHANITVVLNYANDSESQAWSSPPVDNMRGLLTVDMDRAWLKGYSRNNLTFLLTANGKTYDGPEVSLRHPPPRHAPNQTSAGTINKQGLTIGLPVALGFVLIVVVGLWIGMRKHRKIGLGNIMSRSRHGYGTGKSRRQRMGRGKKDAVRLQERELLNAREPEYRDEALPRAIFAQGHTREVSLGSLVSRDDEPRNHFRSEMERQRTGR